MLGVASALLLGVSAFAPSAYAQDTAKDDKPEKSDTEKKPASKNGTLSIGDETIDPNQPIKPEFLLNVSVSGEPDPSGNYKVDALGNVAVRYAGVMTPLSVKGLTPAQAQDVIANFLKTYIKNPIVKVTIVDVPRPLIFIGGAVRTTGQVYITSETTLLDVLTRAEYTDNADLSQVRLVRKELVDGKEQQINLFIDFEKYIKVKSGEPVDEKQNPVLKDKDRVYVPPRVLPGSGTVSVFGEVIRPTPSIPLRTGVGMTIREVVNLAGGQTPAADVHRVSIRRVGLDRTLVIDLEKAMQNDPVHNIELKADDTVYVERLENNAFIIMNGAFIRPGRLVFDKRTTLTQAIAEVGGPAPYARETDGVIFRHPDNNPKNSKVIRFDLRKIVKGKANDIDLFPGDAVYIAPGSAPRGGFGVLESLGALTSAAYLYNTLSGRTGSFR